MEVVEETHRQIYFPPIEQANNWQMKNGAKSGLGQFGEKHSQAEFRGDTVLVLHTSYLFFSIFVKF